MNDQDPESSLSDLLDGIVEADIAATLKRPEIAAHLIAGMSEETGLPRVACRIFYHWVLVQIVSRIESGVRSALSAERLNLFIRRLIDTGTAQRAVQYMSSRIRTISPDLAPTPIESQLRPLTREDHEELLNSSLGDLAYAISWHPPLSLRLLTSDTSLPNPLPSSRFVANYRHIPYQRAGRDFSHEMLDEFLAHPHQFLWWVVKGRSGSGKTRFALEALIEHLGEWDGGFLERTDQFQWPKWRPTLPTLAIIDYASTRPQDVAITLEQLRYLSEIGALDGYPKVRLILIDRFHPACGFELQDRIWRDIYQDETHFERLLSARFAAPHNLPPLNRSAVKRIIEVFTPPDSDALVQKIEQTIGLDLPLFAALAADAAHEGRNITDWDERSIVRATLTARRAPWKFGTTEGRLASYLVAVPTALGGAQSIYLRSFLRVDAETFERAASVAASVTGSHGPLLEPLKPDPLGEAFFLLFWQWLQDNAPISEIMEFSSFLWSGKENHLNPVRLIQLVIFLHKCRENYGESGQKLAEPCATSLNGFLQTAPVDRQSQIARAVALAHLAAISQNPDIALLDEISLDDVAEAANQGVAEEATVALYGAVIVACETDRADIWGAAAAHISRIVDSNSTSDARMFSALAFLRLGNKHRSAQRWLAAIESYESVRAYILSTDSERLRRIAADALSKKAASFLYISRTDCIPSACEETLEYISSSDGPEIRLFAVHTYITKAMGLFVEGDLRGSLSAYDGVLDFVTSDDPTPVTCAGAFCLYMKAIGVEELVSQEAGLDCLDRALSFVQRLVDFDRLAASEPSSVAEDIEDAARYARSWAHSLTAPLPRLFEFVLRQDPLAPAMLVALLLGRKSRLVWRLSGPETARPIALQFLRAARGIDLPDLNKLRYEALRVEHQGRR